MSAPALSPGAAVLIQPVRARVTGLTLAKHGVLAALAFAPPAFWALIEGQWALAAALGGAALFGLLAFAAAWKLDLPRDLRQVEALATLALLFLLTAVLSVPAFIALGMPLHAALFEGMSAVTTTGLSMASSPDEWPFAAHFLRAWLQWCGGLVMVTAVLAFLLGPSQAAAQMGRQGVDLGDRLASTRAQARQLLGVYGGLTALFALPAMLLAPDWREGLVLILSAVSTGGFAPLSTSLSSYSPLLQGWVTGACLTGAISFLTVVLLARGAFKEAWHLGSLRRLCVTLGITFALWFGLADTLSWSASMNLISAITTAGFSVGPMPDAPELLLLLVLVMVMGGSVGSTAGGLKLDRVALIGHAVRHALQRMQMPDSAVLPLRDGTGPVDPDTLVRTVALLALIFGTIGVLWIWLVAAGYPALPALFDTVSALATVGLSTGAVVGPDLPPALALGFTFVMWAGRLEFIAVLLLLKPSTWRVFGAGQKPRSAKT